MVIKEVEEERGGGGRGNTWFLKQFRNWLEKIPAPEATKLTIQPFAPKELAGHTHVPDVFTSTSPAPGWNQVHGGPSASIC